MAFIFDIPQQFRGLYGFRAESLEVNARNPRSTLGDEVFKMKEGVWQFMPVSLGGIDLWNPIIRIQGRKTVVETQMVERAGSVKEIISLDDYVINIRGLIKRVDGSWPDRELAELEALWTRNEAIPIRSAITAILMNGNEYVVLTNLNLPERPGHTELIAYEMEMVSDTQFELEIE